jgi:hypothetical protein
MWLLLLTIFLPTFAFASPAEEPEERNIPILDTTQALFGGQVNTVANRLDLFFADQRADDELARSRIRLRKNYEVRERATFSDDTTFRVNIRLPHLQGKFKFDRDDEKDEKNKDPKAPKKEVTVEEYGAYKLDKSWQFRADAGVNASIHPKVFGRARLRKNWETGDLIHRFVEDWEENTTLDSDLSLNEETLLRLGHSTDWKVTRKGFTTSHGPSIRRRLSDDEGVSIGTSLSTVVEEGVWYVNNYRISTTYRRNLYKHWLYMDLTPGLDFPKTWSFRRTPFIALQFEALFGGF